MAEKLTKKEKGFVRDVVKTNNPTKAILNNFNIGGKHGTNNKNGVASVMANEYLKKPKIMKAIQTLADKIPEEKIEQVLLEGLDAGRTINVGETSTYEADYGTRHKYLDTAIKLKGLYAPEKKKIELNEELIDAIKGRVSDILE